MTNKNKRTRPRLDAAAKKKAEKTAAIPSKQPSIEPAAKGILTRGQLTALIFLFMGISRLFQVGSAIRKEGNIETCEEDGNFTMPDQLEPQADKSCLHFFNGTGDGSEWTPASTCVEDGFNALLKYKYTVGWQVVVLVAAVILQCWHVEEWLLRFNTGLIVVSPILPSVLSLLLCVPDLIAKKSIWPHMIMALVLSYVGSPMSFDFLPFLTKPPAAIPPRGNTKSVQSLVLLGLASFFFLQAIVQWGVPLLPSLYHLHTSKDVMTATSNSLSWINEELLTSATKTPSSLVVTLLLLVDKLTIALVYIFSWFYLPEQQQRTILLYTGVIYFCVATYQWTWLDHQIANALVLQGMDWALAGFGIISWLAPSFVTKKKEHSE